MAGNTQDLQLVERCIARSPGAWRAFVDRFAPTIKALAHRYLRHLGQPADTATSEDIVQDVFLALTRKDHRLLRNYDPKFTVKTYLGVITRTEVHRSVRRKRPRTVAPEEIHALSPNEPDSAGLIEQAEEHDLLHRALLALPTRDAEILRLRFLREREYKQIAAQMGIPESSVGQTLFRAKQRLLEELKGSLDGSRRNP